GTAKEDADAKEQLESFLRSPRVCDRTDDDLTLLLATFSSSEAQDN
ncbi:MAG: protein phosphatase 2C domain-containing protein, partial [Microcoleus sp. PH2017_04_SCI_O_A]|nr:protein phosphatase 2C domain-containing protein [Microcoleus sp. PH2017_04_SCI_O_A]